MQCPVDGETLVMADRNGIEIDYCPKCRGIWLDRGELDKIIERSVAPMAQSNQGAVPPRTLAEPGASRPEPRYRKDDDDDDHREDYRGGKRRKRESFLSELFDF